VSFFWIYDLPNWLLGLLTVLVFAGLAAAGLVASRPLVRRALGPPPGQNDVVSYYLGAFGVFYGLTIGLIAVASWQNLADLDGLVNREASALRVLDRAVLLYPAPARGELHRLLVVYVDYVIEQEWPAQARGETPEGGNGLLADFARALAGFEPATAGQQALHAETLRALSRYVELRRERLFSVGTGLPEAVWWVLLIGAALNILLTYLFAVERLAVHLALTLALAVFVALLVFLIAAMDHPFLGDFSVGPDAFVALRQQMAAPGPAS
jgi:Protein of unknown function (DUF4239)